jgi:DegV family protein with EDD domain
MRLGMMVDASCDLPPEVFAQHGILIAPINIRVGDKIWVDDRNPKTTADFFKTVYAPNGGAADAESISTPVEVFHRELMDKVVLNHEYAFVMTLTRARSPIYANATEAASQVIREAVMTRFKAGNKKAFGMRVINSQQLFSGQGILALEMIDMIQSGMDFTKIMGKIEEAADNTYSYAVPTDLKYIYERASKRGDRSVSLFGVTVGGFLDIKPILRVFRGETGACGKVRKWDAAAEKIVSVVKREHQAGHLLSKHICASYGGPLVEAEATTAVKDLRAYCTENGLTFTLSHMSMTASINVGPGMLGISFIGQEHEF